SFGTAETNRSADRVAQIDLAFNHVVPRGRIGVFEIGHEHLRAGVERVDYHLAIGRSGDLNSAIAQIFRNGRACPVAITDVLCFTQKIQRLTRVKTRLPLVSHAQTVSTATAKFALHFRDKGHGTGGENFLESRSEPAAYLNTVWPVIASLHRIKIAPSRMAASL